MKDLSCKHLRTLELTAIHCKVQDTPKGRISDSLCGANSFFMLSSVHYRKSSQFSKGLLYKIIF